MPKYRFSNNTNNNLITGTGWVICKSEAAAKRVVACLHKNSLEEKESGGKFAYDLELIKDKILFTYRGVFYPYLVLNPLEITLDEYKKGRFYFVADSNKVYQVTLGNVNRPIRIATISKETEGEENDD